MAGIGDTRKGTVSKTPSVVGGIGTLIGQLHGEGNFAMQAIVDAKMGFWSLCDCDTIVGGHRYLTTTVVDGQGGRKTTTAQILVVDILTNGCGIVA